MTRPAPSQAVRYEWLASLPEVHALEQHWRELERRVRDRMVFGTYDHMALWSECHGGAYGTPLVGAAWRDGFAYFSWPAIATRLRPTPIETATASKTTAAPR